MAVSVAHESVPHAQFDLDEAHVELDTPLVLGAAAREVGTAHDA